MSEKIVLYICDPEKNTECDKIKCYAHGGPCHCTMDKELAKKDNYGRPIPALGVDYLNDD